MEVDKLLHVKDVLKRHTLTLLGVVRGVICLFVLLSTAFMMLVYGWFFTAVILRFFNIHYSRRATYFVFGSWLGLWPFFFEKINNTKVVFSGEIVPAKERVLTIAKHTTEVDWIYLWDLALRKGRLRYVKYILKSSLMKLPIFGWAFHILEFISVERRWEVDESPMRQMLSTFKNPKDLLWLAVFQKAQTSLYDITIGYKDRCPSFLDNAFGLDPSEVHIHVERISLNDIPISRSKVGSWFMNRFCMKDHLLSDFYRQGRFPGEGTEGKPSTVMSLVNAFGVIILTVICMFFTFFSPAWFRIYVSLVLISHICHLF